MGHKGNRKSLDLKSQQFSCTAWPATWAKVRCWDELGISVPACTDKTIVVHQDSFEAQIAIWISSCFSYGMARAHKAFLQPSRCSDDRFLKVIQTQTEIRSQIDQLQNTWARNAACFIIKRLRVHHCTSYFITLNAYLHWGFTIVHLNRFKVMSVTI